MNNLFISMLMIVQQVQVFNIESISNETATSSHNVLIVKDTSTDNHTETWKIFRREEFDVRVYLHQKTGEVLFSEKISNQYLNQQLKLNWNNLEEKSYVLSFVVEGRVFKKYKVEKPNVGR